VFDQLKMAGALAGLMKNKDGLKQAGERIRLRLGEMRAAGSAGGGAVQVTVSGQMTVIEVRLSAALVAGLGDDGSRAMAESLIAEATNDAIKQARTMAQREIAKEAEALGLPNIPGLDNLLGG
jgi:DNA-binding protein YbaB